MIVHQIYEIPILGSREDFLLSLIDQKPRAYGFLEEKCQFDIKNLFHLRKLPKKYLVCGLTVIFMK